MRRARAVTVDDIYDNVGDTVRVSGVNSEGYGDYNNIYRITDIPIGYASSITVASASTISGFSTTGVGVTLALLAVLHGGSELLGNRDCMAMALGCFHFLQQAEAKP